jgi:hypothetical protein
MAASTRITARNIIFKIGTTDYACDATKVELTLGDAPGDVQTFCEQRVGGQWTLSLEGITSGDSASLYRVLWANFGTTAAFTIAPNGNATEGTSQPHYKGTVKFDSLPPMSLNSNEATKFTVQLTVDNSTHNPSGGVYYGVTLDASA